MLLDKGANVVKLIVKSGHPNNCILRDSVTINVEILVEIKIPNGKAGLKATFRRGFLNHNLLNLSNQKSKGLC